VETLRTVKKVEKSVLLQRSVLDKTVVEVDSKRKVEQMVTLAQAVRQVMSFRNTSTMRMPELLSALSSQQTNDFTTGEQRKELLQSLARVVPEWIVVKDVGNVRIVKLVSSMDMFSVKQKIVSN
jgi:hypothetical protein